MIRLAAMQVKYLHIHTHFIQCAIKNTRNYNIDHNFWKIKQRQIFVWEKTVSFKMVMVESVHLLLQKSEISI